MPSYAYGGYDPFRYGHWQNYGSSWPWVNSMPWGYNTFHSGRWAYLDDLNRWCWVPARRHRPREHVADTVPIRLVLDDGRPTGYGKDRLPVVHPRSDDDSREPVATTQGTPRRIDADRVPVWRRDVESTKTSRNESPTPRVNPDQAPPARPADSRKQTSSSPAPATSREFGRFQPP